MFKKVTGVALSLGILFQLPVGKSYAEEVNIANSEEVGVQQSVTATMSPTLVIADAYEYKTITVYSSHGTNNYFTFDAGDGTVRQGYGSNSKAFSHYWVTNSYKEFTTRAMVDTLEYGPSPWTYGKAQVTYR